MNTKEAIEFLKLTRENFDAVPSWKKSSKIYERISKIIELLRRGEAFEKIVNEMEEFLEPGVIMEIPEDMVGSRHIDIIKYTFKNIKQKYFPEILKKTVTIEIEAKDTEDLASSLRDIGNFVSSPGITKMKVINIGKMKKGVK